MNVIKKILANDNTDRLHWNNNSIDLVSSRIDRFRSWYTKKGFTRRSPRRWRKIQFGSIFANQGSVPIDYMSAAWNWQKWHD